MISFFTLLKNDIKLFFKDWKAVALILIMPFLFICLFAYALAPYLNKSNFVEPFKIAIVDKEETTQTRVLAKQLDEIHIFKEILRTDEKSAKDLLSQNKIAAIFIIPDGFSDSLLYGEIKPINVIGNKAMPLQSFVAKTTAESAANLVTAGQSAINTIYHYNEKLGVKEKALEKEFNDSTMKLFLEMLARDEIYSHVELSQNLDLTPVEYFTSALIVIFLMFSGMPGMKMLVSERSQGIIKRLATTRVRFWKIILSKFLVSVLLSTIQFSIIIILTSVVFKNYWGAPVKSILLLFVGIIFAVSSWSVFVSAISKTPAAADVIGNLGILLMAVIGGSIYPLASMPGFVRALSNITINKWAMNGFMTIFSGNDALSVANNVYALLAIGTVLLIFSIGAMKLRKS